MDLIAGHGDAGGGNVVGAQSPAGFRWVAGAGGPPEYPLADQPAPQLAWIEIAQLVIDDGYQRPLQRANLTAIRKIARNFRWSRFAPVLVAPVEGGFFAIVDGQHRTHAAALCGIVRVPCQVVPMDRREQAQAFASVNGDQIAVTPLQVYRAALLAGEGWAIACRDTCAAAGCRLLDYNPTAEARRAGHLTCVALLRAHIEAGRGHVVKAGLAALVRSRGDDRFHFTGGVLRIWFGALASDPAFLRLDLAAFLDKMSLVELLDQAQQMRRSQRIVDMTGLAFAQEALVRLLRRAVEERC